METNTRRRKLEEAHEDIVLKHDEQNPLLLDITVEPVQDLEKLTSVAVVVDTPGEEEK